MTVLVTTCTTSWSFSTCCSPQCCGECLGDVPHTSAYLKLRDMSRWICVHSDSTAEGVGRAGGAEIVNEGEVHVGWVTIYDETIARATRIVTTGE